MQSQIIAHLFHQKFPDITSLTPARQGFIYLDTNAQRPPSGAGGTILRPPVARRDGLSTAHEVQRTLDPGKFTIKTIRQCLRATWSGLSF